jgi:hypothetical protein
MIYSFSKEQIAQIAKALDLGAQPGWPGQAARVLAAAMRLEVEGVTTRLAVDLREMWVREVYEPKV